MNQDAAGIDLVVGAKGSPLQLILSSVYHVDFPTGNIKMEEAQKLSRNRLVKNIIPLALGDNFEGFRIVGTNHDYLELYSAEFAEGKPWEVPFEVVIGSEIAAKLNLKPGAEFTSSHGISVGSHDHDEHKFVVSGILKPNGNVVDRLILTSVESVWYAHDEAPEAVELEASETTGPNQEMPEVEEQNPQNEAREDGHSKFHSPIAKTGFPLTDEDREVTTLLLQYRNPIAAVQLPRMINSGTSMQAASPSFEMSRLFELLGVGISLLQGLAFVLIAIAGLGIFIALYNSLKERKYDLAILRAIGASRNQLLALIFFGRFDVDFAWSHFGHWVRTCFSLVVGQSRRSKRSSSTSAMDFLKTRTLDRCLCVRGRSGGIDYSCRISLSNKHCKAADKGVISGNFRNWNYEKVRFYSGSSSGFHICDSRIQGSGSLEKLGRGFL